MKYLKLYENIEDINIEKELNYYKNVYSRYFKSSILSNKDKSNRLEEDFIKIIKGEPIKITDKDDRNIVEEEVVLPLKNENDLLYYKAYVTPEAIQKSPSNYEFVTPVFRDKDSLNWIKVKVKEVENLDNNALGGLSVVLEDGWGGTSLAYLFLVTYSNTGY